ncbi:hypothetical protein D1007_47406 [Hordeum vulgare]|nr:hypothetical protein D1007_47406 [Hordeum vulgare]
MVNGHQASRHRRVSLCHDSRGEQLHDALEECFLKASVAIGHLFSRVTRLRADSRTAVYACHIASSLEEAPPRLALEAAYASPKGVPHRCSHGRTSRQAEPSREDAHPNHWQGDPSSI